jgi:hypothetical protein
MTAPIRKRLTHADVEQVRRARHRSMLLFITDRCPVGCLHCSVDSRADSPTITDFKLFGDIVEWICERPIEVVGISGGEPFVERCGLTFASRRLVEAAKQQVIYTSGVWANSTTPPWIAEVIARCSCVYLSTDAFHAPSVNDDRFVRALEAIASVGTWIVVQVVDHQGALSRVERLLHVAFGENPAGYAEINPIRPLTNGRGSNVFSRNTWFPGHAFGPCALAMSPMVRYDGLVTGCCNESVIMNQGPSRLRRKASSAELVSKAVDAFHADPLLRVIAGSGLGALTVHPRLADLGDQLFTSNCELCWKILDRMPANDDADRLVNVLASLDIERGA